MKNEYLPDFVSHPSDSLEELNREKGSPIQDLDIGFWRSRVDHYADYVAEKRLSEYKNIPFLCKLTGHKYKIVRWNKWFIPTGRICVRCNKTQEHVFALKNESGDNLWMDIVDDKEEIKE